MTVEPTNRGHVKPSKTGKPTEAEVGEHPQPQTEPAPNVPKKVIDTVDFPLTAQQIRELSNAERIESDTLPAERMKEILNRISDGFYDKPDVIDETARRLVDDI